ncbi:hypothetical protein ACIPRL_36060 [Streptomyces sp. NPDC090085]|uniref:hypothetical protein n=1 Tax=Streptomyces sp. NPDC090085 TaxID=3365943 RepID=UPI003809C25C
MRRIATIGVYGFTVAEFFHELAASGAGLLLDLRQRRGVQGHDYAWANAARLQRALAAAARASARAASERAASPDR